MIEKILEGEKKFNKENNTLNLISDNIDETTDELIYTPEQFGAIGDGQTDDTVAIHLKVIKIGKKHLTKSISIKF